MHQLVQLTCTWDVTITVCVCVSQCFSSYLDKGSELAEAAKDNDVISQAIPLLTYNNHPSQVDQ